MVFSGASVSAKSIPNPAFPAVPRAVQMTTATMPPRRLPQITRPLKGKKWQKRGITKKNNIYVHGRQYMSQWEKFRQKR